MISIIVSSYNHKYFCNLKKSIEESIGNVIYEIIKIDNPGIMSICEAYNKGAYKAQYKNLLFVHEDVLFVDHLWGEKLINILQKPNCGIVGVAGGDYYSYVPASWWNTQHNFLHFIQFDTVMNENFNNRAGFKNGQSEITVKSLDGVFLACKREVYDDIKFDERLTGYHGYDLIFSLKAAKKYTNLVTDKILIKHLSEGTLTKEWLENILKVRQIIGVFPSQKLDKSIEVENFYKLIHMMKNFGFDKAKILAVVFKYLSPSKIGFINSIKILARLRYI